MPPAHVVDDDLLAEHLGEVLRQDAAEHVDRAACGKRYHHGHRTGRPILSRRNTGDNQAENCRGCDQHRPDRHVTSLKGP
jgi:hypothetical protein